MNSRKEMQNWDREKKDRQTKDKKPTEAYSRLPALPTCEKTVGNGILRPIAAEY